MNLALMYLIDRQFLETPFYGKCETHPAADAPNVNLTEAEHKQASQETQDIPLSAGRTASRSAQSGLVRRHHLFADAAGFPST